jgi:hypothetical protein
MSGLGEPTIIWHSFQEDDMSTDVPVSLIRPDSLGDTLEAVNVALFDAAALPMPVRMETAEWIADRQGLPGSYAGMFAPTGYDYAFGTQTFTGEPVRSGAATGHVLSEEACRALYRLAGDAASSKNHPVVGQALDRARQSIFHRIEQSEAKGQWSGVYCCGTCSVALWRHLLASGAAEDQRRLENGLAELHRYRDGEGRWKRFPFYYTLLALTEIDLHAAAVEAQYAGAVIERLLRRLSKAERDGDNKFDWRRKVVLERILEKC